MKDDLHNIKTLGKGIPCNHPGCCSHESHPCEICSRIACGLIERPATVEDIK